MQVPDNYDLFLQHEAEQEERLSKLPVCQFCKEPIQQEAAVYYNHKWYCEECEAEAWEEIREDFLEPID